MIEAPSPTSALSRFASPVDSFGPIDPQTTATLLVTACDVALVVSAEGVIVDAAFGNPELAKEAYRDWIGKRWADTVTSESRPKIEELVRDTGTHTASRWRQINYPATEGPDVPVRYSAIRSARIGGSSRSAAICAPWRSCSSVSPRRSRRWSVNTRAYATLKNAIACCSSSPPRRC